MTEDYVAMCAECKTPVDRKDLHYVNGLSYHAACSNNSTPSANGRLSADETRLKVDIVTLKNLRTQMGPSRKKSAAKKKTPKRKTAKKKTAKRTAKKKMPRRTAAKKKTIKRTVKKKTAKRTAKKKTPRRTAAKKKTVKRTVGKKTARRTVKRKPAKRPARGTPSRRSSKKTSRRSR